MIGSSQKELSRDTSKQSNYQANDIDIMSGLIDDLVDYEDALVEG